MQHRLTEGPIGKQLYLMALPMVIGLLANMSIQIMDAWFISMLGPEPLAAMGFIFPVAMITFSLAIGISAGASSIIARKLPEGDKPGLARLITDTQSLSICLALVAAIVGWMTVNPLFRLLGAPEYLLPLIRDYIYIFYFNSIIAMMGMVALSSMRAMGNAKLQGQAMLVGALVNAVLDPILIFGLLGAPRLEIQGAALASMMSRLVSLLMAYYVLQGKMHLITNPFISFSRVWQSWKLVLHVALPAVGTNIIIPMSAAIITVLLATYGENAVAGMGVAGRIEPLMLIAFYALSAVIGPFVGQNLGLNQISRVTAGVNTACYFSMLFGVLLAVVLWLFAKPLVGLFSDLPQVLTVARDYLWIVPISYGCAGVVMVISASFNGMGKPLPATMISVMRVLVLYLPLAHIGSILFGIKGIFIAYATVNVLSAVIAYFWFKSYIKTFTLIDE